MHCLLQGHSSFSFFLKSYANVSLSDNRVSEFCASSGVSWEGEGRAVSVGGP